MKKKLSVIAVLAAFSVGAHAADAGTPTLSQVLDASGVSISGYMDFAYNKMDTTGLFTSALATPNNAPFVGGYPGNSRIFDTQGATFGQNYSSFEMHQLGLIVSKAPKEGVGGLVNITAGQDAQTVSSVGLSTTNADLTQAYMSYATGGLTVIAGKFATLAGAELITSPSNTNYSRAWMFGWGPYTHTGVRATYMINDKVSVIAGVNNGFDQTISTTTGKTSELSIALAPVDMFSLNITNYHGNELTGAATGPGYGTRNYTDVLATLKPTAALSLVADYANATQDGATLATGAVGKAKWKALATYVNYKFTDSWSASYRHESFNDPDGYRSGTPQNLKSNTLTVAYAMGKTLMVRGEWRKDTSDVNSFLKSDGTGTNGQTSYSLETIYQF